MTIFGSHVDPHIPNIGYLGLDVCGGIYRYMNVYKGIWKNIKVYASI